MATLVTLKNVFAPRVLDTSKNTLLVLWIPLLVISVTGNHTANAIRKIFAPSVVGNTLNANGIHAVVGIGPIIFVTGFNQYPTLLLYPKVSSGIGILVRVRHILHLLSIKDLYNKDVLLPFAFHYLQAHNRQAVRFLLPDTAITVFL